MISSSAVISPCGKYRYWLEMFWEKRLSPQVFIMLNPSTADATLDDATIRRCIGFSKRLGAPGMIIVNLFGLRSRDPELLLKSEDPTGPRNGEHIAMALLSSSITGRPAICAWGSRGSHLDHDKKLIKSAQHLETKLVCLGVTKAGQPRHPLYPPGNTKLEPFGQGDSK